jgi:LCP family protein required for cell wall assembly
MKDLRQFGSGILLALISIALILGGFSLALNEGFKPALPPQLINYVLVTGVPNATVTPTPFQPVTSAQTPTLAENSQASNETSTGFIWGSYPAPEIYPASIQIPPPVGLIKQPDGQVNILLLGSDQRPNEGGFRTDTIILATLNPSLGTINLTSFPRDLYVYIPGWTMQRINTAMGHGGNDTLSLTMEYNFGVRPDHNIMVSFSGFVNIIDSLGGLDVEVAQSLSDERQGYGIYYVPAGTVHMDGGTALWYVRSRGTSNDIDRLRRAQEVMQAFGYRLLSFNALLHASDFYSQYSQNVITDLTLGDLTGFLPVVTKMSKPENIKRFIIGYGQVTDWIEPYSGAMVLLPNREAILQIMYQALNAQ